MQTCQLFDEHKQEIISLKASLNEQIDRSVRSTLVFKGIPKEKIKYLSTTFKWNTNELNKDIERAHRGMTNEVSKTNSKNDAIYVKFES